MDHTQLFAMQSAITPSQSSAPSSPSGQSSAPLFNAPVIQTQGVNQNLLKDGAFNMNIYDMKDFGGFAKGSDGRSNQPILPGNKMLDSAQVHTIGGVQANTGFSVAPTLHGKEGAQQLGG